MLDCALQEVESALEIGSSYDARYNKACYTALRYGTNIDREGMDKVCKMLEEAQVCAVKEGATNAIRKCVEKDIKPDRDLRALKGPIFIETLLSGNVD